MSLTLDRLVKINSLYFRLLRDEVPIEGVIMLPIIAGQPPQHVKVWLDFLVVKVPSTYNAILNQPQTKHPPSHGFNLLPVGEISNKT